ncbi:hypothetical protein [Streptomyces sp. NPDC052225]|uniref:hypothetical protein n=1 Tax=Streptomyces sp. NPDC052225 TaxID=3154949 RepID=UPI00342715DF
MAYAIGLALIVIGAPLVGIAGNVIGDNVHEGAGKAISIGGVLAVLGIAAWLIIGSL